MTNNPALYDAALSALAASNNAWPIAPTPDRTPSANALALAVDAAIPAIPGGASLSQRELLGTILQNFSQGRDLNVSNYSSIAAIAASIFLQFSPLLLTGTTNQSDWYIDQVNGSDSNTGKLGSPLASQEELVRRIFPNQTRLLLSQDVNVFVAPGTFSNMYFGVGSADGLVHTLRVICQTTPGATLTISAVTQVLAPTTRGQLTTLAGAFVAGQRIRLLTGTSAGAIAYSTGLNGGPLSTFNSGFVSPHHADFHNFSFASPGDTCMQETLAVLIRRIELDCGPNSRIEVRDAQITRTVVNGDCGATPSGDAGGNVTFSGCEAVSAAGDWQCNAGGANLFGCRWVPTTKTALRGNGWLNWGSVVQGIMGVASGSVSSYGLCIDGGQLWLNTEDNFEYKGNQGYCRFNANQSYNQSGTIEVENGGNAFGVGAAINLLTGGELFNCGRTAGNVEIWGQSAPYAIGFALQPGSWLYQTGALADANQFLNLAIPSAVNLNVAGATFAYSAAPRPDPNHNCGVIAGS